MQINELIEKAQLVVDSKGKKSAVQLDYRSWEELLAFLEYLDCARRSDEECAPSIQAKNSLEPVASEKSSQRHLGLCAGEFMVPDNFDDPLPENVIEEFEGRRYENA